jgi:hypothetical protein
MKTFPGIRVCIAAGFGLVAATTWAQKEQWLEYRTESEERRGYRWLDLSTNRPANVALPKLVDQPYFARWTSPLDSSGGRWACFDRTKRSGPYDRVYLDSNGNGKLDDETAIGTTRVDQYSAYFEPAKVVFKGEDGPITYHLAFRFMNYEGSQANLLVSSAGYYTGTVEFAGKKRTLELIDQNVNGVFNDIGKNVGDCDAVKVEKDKVYNRYLGKMIEVEGEFFYLEVARDGAFIKLKKAENLTFGQVKVPETISEFVAFGANGHFVRKPEKGAFTLPAGSYRMHEWTINRKDSRGAAWQLRGDAASDSLGFQVAEGKPATVAVGEPIRAIMTADQMTNQVSFNLSFQGPQNERVSIRKGSENPPGPKLTLASMDGTFRATNTFEFG